MNSRRFIANPTPRGRILAAQAGMLIGATTGLKRTTGGRRPCAISNDPTARRSALRLPRWFAGPTFGGLLGRFFGGGSLPGTLSVGCLPPALRRFFRRLREAGRSFLD